jgi:hypothetical protein
MTPARIWNDAENERLREIRQPHLLRPGDEIYIPERRPRSEVRSTDKRHRFRRKVPKVWLRIAFMDETGSPRKGAKYWLDIESEKKQYEGKCNSEGLLEVLIPPHVQRARLLLQPESVRPAEFETYELYIQALDPLDSLSGACARLNNLGLLTGTADDIDPGVAKAAISAFQAENELPVTGELDDRTQKALRKQYGT